MLSTAQFVQRTAIVFAFAVTLLALWRLADVLLLIFGGIIIALIIRSGGDFVSRYAPVSPRWASLLVVLAGAVLVAIVSLLIGDEVSRQLQQLGQRLPQSLENARQYLQANQVGQYLLTTMQDASVPVSRALQTASATFGALADLGVVILVALYLSFSPGTYRRGTVALVPEPHQPLVRQAMHTSGKALRGWLVGQLISMTLIGILTGVGLWIAGVPLALILGLVAGLLNFVPVIGPFVAAIPGILLGFAQGPATALYAALVYFIVQQLEGAIIMPLAQRWSVHLPPALGLISIVVFGLLFGIPGVLFATPLTVVIMALVKRFYVDQGDDRKAQEG